MTRQSGHVTGFSMRNAPGTNIFAATAIALAEFPSDAKVAWSTSNDVCAQAQVRSPILGAALAAESDPTGGVLIAFYTDAASTQGSYRPENIRDMIFLATDAATPSDAPAC